MINVKDVILHELITYGRCSAGDKTVGGVLLGRLREHGITFGRSMQLYGGLTPCIRGGFVEVVREKGEKYLDVTEKGRLEPRNLITDDMLPLFIPSPFKAKAKAKRKEKKKAETAKPVDEYAFLNELSVTQILGLISHASTMVKDDIEKFKQGMMKGL